jgi:sec-independent protein translocase protein TatA
MFGLNPFELTVILVIILLIFGVGRVGKIAGEMGKGIREFRKGLSHEEANPEAKVAEE